MLNVRYVIQPIATCISQVFRYVCLWNCRNHLEFSQLLDFCKSCDHSDLGVGHLEASESESLLICSWLQHSPHLINIASSDVVSERLVQQLDWSGRLVRAGEKWTQFRDGILKRCFEKQKKQCLPCSGRQW